MSSDKCNICGGPRQIEYNYVNPETHELVREKKTVDCLGHDGVLPYLWNKHPLYPRYVALKERQRNSLAKGLRTKEKKQQSSRKPSITQTRKVVQADGTESTTVTSD